MIVVDIYDRIIERGCDLNIWGYTRVDTVNERILAKMKQAGIYCVAYGFESGSKKVLDVVTKGYKQEAMQKAVKMTYDTGLYIIGNFIFGLPDDDYESMRETLDLAKELNCEFRFS